MYYLTDEPMEDPFPPKRYRRPRPRTRVDWDKYEAYKNPVYGWALRPRRAQ